MRQHSIACVALLLLSLVVALGTLRAKTSNQPLAPGRHEGAYTITTTSSTGTWAARTTGEGYEVAAGEVRFVDPGFYVDGPPMEHVVPVASVVSIERVGH